MPILVVDDDPAIRGVLVEILRDEGYRVEAAADGREALAVIERERPSLLVLDMNMPVLDGWGVARALRDRGVQVPVLVLTAAHSAAACAAEIAADGYIAKPFDIDGVLQAVARLRVPRG